jgi:hypothetical protein
LKNIKEKTCLLSPDSLSVQIISTGIVSFIANKGKDYFNASLILSNGYKVRLPVNGIRNIPNKETLVDFIQIADFISAEEAGWYPCRIETPDQPRHRIWKDLPGLFSRGLDPFNAKIKII